jgi:hypothetical protein
VFLLPPSVLFMSWSLKSIAFNILGDVEEENRRSKILQANLSLAKLLEMVERGEIGTRDGALTEFEYIQFMLVRSGLVPTDTLRALHDNFTMLDADGSGDLTREDLRLIYAASVPKDAADEKKATSFSKTTPTKTKTPQKGTSFQKDTTLVGTGI